MDQNSSLINLKKFITCPDNEKYEQWVCQPLAEKFKNNSEWSEKIVANLFSKDDNDALDALLTCRLLLNEIEENNKKIKNKYNKARYLRLCNIIIPLFTFTGQIYFKLYGPLETVFTGYLVSKCTNNFIKFGTTSQNYLYHSTALLQIKNEITTKVELYEKNLKNMQKTYENVIPILKKKQTLELTINLLQLKKNMHLKYAENPLHEN